jgi:ribose 1,5-bisphosphate isomerase
MLLEYLSEATDRYDADSTMELVRELDKAKFDILQLDGPNGLLLNAVRNAVDELPMDAHHAKELVRTRLRSFIRELEIANEAAINNGSKIIEENDVVLTHCHSSLVWNAFLRASREGKKLKVYVTETRPRFDGYSIVKGLAEAGISATLIVDSAAGYYIQNKSVGKVMLGLDCISSDRYVYNKIGTYSICLCAQENNVPIYFLTTKSKIVQERKREISQVFFSKEEIASPLEFPNVTIESPVFDVFPAKYADYVVTEDGVMESKYLNMGHK